MDSSKQSLPEEDLPQTQIDTPQQVNINKFYTKKRKYFPLAILILVVLLILLGGIYYLIIGKQPALQRLNVSNSSNPAVLPSSTPIALNLNRLFVQYKV